MAAHLIDDLKDNSDLEMILWISISAENILDTSFVGKFRASLGQM
jgi:hypothetical protein